MFKDEGSGPVDDIGLLLGFPGQHHFLGERILTGDQRVLGFDGFGVDRTPRILLRRVRRGPIMKGVNIHASSYGGFRCLTTSFSTLTGTSSSDLAS